MKAACALLAAIGLSAPAVLASEDPPAALALRRTPHAPRLESFRGMTPAIDARERLVKVEGFVQRVPRDGAMASERTEAWMTYDDQHVYVIFVCFDSEPEAVRARLVPRGTGILEDDHVSIQIDTFHDRRRAYAFTANPLGVQSTAVWVEGQGWDHAFDTVWRVDAIRTPRGYVVMMSIPFESLRFAPQPRQTWGVMLQRTIPRRNEEAYWPAYSSRVEGRLNQTATLTGLEGVSPGRDVQFLPYAAVRSFRAVDERGAAPAEVIDPADPRVGLDAKLVVNDRVVVDLTANPDFSQVESDEPQVTVNQRFERFYPEKRPFFLENASYFQTPIPLLFTRRIGDPGAGARLTGKLGPWAVAALAADDRAPGAVLPADDPDAGRRALVGAARVARDVGRRGTVGAIVTDREFAGGHNRVAGADARVTVGRHWAAAFQAAGSRTRARDGASVAGTAFEAALDRAGRQFTYALRYTDRSPGFATELGFSPRADIRSIHQLASYRFRPEGRLVSWGPDVLVDRVWDHGGAPLDLAIGPALHWEFTRQTTVGAYYLKTAETLSPAQFGGLAEARTYRGERRGLMFSTAARPELSMRASIETGHGVNVAPAPGAPPAPSRYVSADAGLAIRPARSVTLETGYLLTRLGDRATGNHAFTNHILRQKVNYQATRALSLRVILQYDAVLASPARTALETRKRLNADVLLTYLIDYGTALYVGYNHDLRDPDPLGGIRRPAGGRSLATSARQVFVKLSYLVRF